MEGKRADQTNQGNHMIIQYTLLLEGGTGGRLVSSQEVKAGDVVTVKLHDYNGNPIQATGTVVDVLQQHVLCDE